MIDVGTTPEIVAKASSDEDSVPVRAATRISLIAEKRSAIGMSAVGTSIRASVNALLPLLSFRVLIAIDARNDSTGAPISR